MAEESLREHQLRAVEAMKMIDGICTENGIGYFLIAGSTLGAVRHKGFIPWDDDIDIAMTMDQFGRFLEIAPGAIGDPYRFRHTSVDEDYPTLSAGIFYGEDEPLITVFPLIKLSDGKFGRKSQWMIRKVMSPVWQRKVGYAIPAEKKNAKNRFAVIVSTVLSVFFTKKTALRFLRWNETRYEDKDVRWYCNLYSKYSQEKESIRADWMKDTIRVPFEDAQFPIVKEYDAYLTHLYGDYMTPPPESERQPEHL